MEKRLEDWTIFEIDGKKYSLYGKDIDKLKDLEEDERRALREKLIENGEYFDLDTCIDIYSKGTFEQRVLSNFYPADFELDGIKIKSLEGFIQSLKTPDTERQKEICLLVGKEAKKAGHEIEGFDGKTLYWNGERIDRFSPEYKTLLENAFEERMKNDEDFVKVLNSIRDKKIIHTIGSNNREETVLTVDELIALLEGLKEKLK